MADEYIKVDDAINKAYELYEESDFIRAEELSAFVKSIPAADVAPVRHGRWKPYDLTCGMRIYHCSACEQASDVPTRMGKPIYNYYPNCGAKMEVQDV